MSSPESPSESSSSSRWDPGLYGRVNTLQEYVAQQALTGLSLRGDERVLDVGCGDGRVTAAVLDRLTTGVLHGVDPSPAMVAAATARFAGDPRVSFAVATAATLTYRAEFDLATSFNALHWEIHWVEALARVRAALHDDGRAFLVFVCAGDRPSIEDVFMQTAESPRWRQHFADFAAPFVHVDPDAYAAAATAAGFRVERIERVDLEWDFTEPAAFAGWAAAGTPAWTGRLPAADRARFVGDALADYREIVGSDSVFRFLQCRVALSAAPPASAPAASAVPRS